ncbi:sensor histidine kinase [Dinghuibacter silviterrae]|uniref:histidine kinase n=1 Tax=Dinghuibacter silviterrae TaxID=1539049 RepID=A0A4R8DGT6_9BACT|nr:PAS domain-containing sensor histidine kinase [Dinghuibacter silviterrae]TDW96725.1 PAS domain S-box-containing protein [Dinghuibacter silviterrae]
MDGGSDYNVDLFFELSADLLCIAGFDGYFKRINPAVSKVLGYSIEELMSRPINDFVYQEDKAITDKHRDNLRRDIPLLNFENRYVTKSGEIVWLSWTSMPLEKEKLVYAIAKNITHKKKQEEDRNHLIAQLSQASEELKHQSYRTSHDLRYPVNNLLSILTLLDGSKIQDGETLEFIGLLNATAQDLQRTLNEQVERLGRKEDGSATLETLSLETVLGGVTSSLRTLLEGARATLHINFSAAPAVRLNKAYLESIFLNLLTNSIKYAHPERPPVITMVSQKTGGRDQLIFSDNGLGIDLDKVGDKVFGFRQHFHEHKDSKGIGLYLVHNYLTSLGGQISVESRVNEGTTFAITFP